MTKTQCLEVQVQSHVICIKETQKGISVLYIISTKI